MRDANFDRAELNRQMPQEGNAGLSMNLESRDASNSARQLTLPDMYKMPSNGSSFRESLLNEASYGVRQNQSSSGSSDKPQNRNLKTFSLLDQNSVRYREKHKQYIDVWNTAESSLALVSGAWFAKRYGSLAYPSPRTAGYLRTFTRSHDLANAFGATVAGVSAAALVDSFLWSGDQKMDTTFATDCVINPVVSLTKLPLRTKVGWMLATHLGARLFDHFRQPQPFLPHPENTSHSKP